jgi:hypothetical protein
MISYLQVSLAAMMELLATSLASQIAGLAAALPRVHATGAVDSVEEAPEHPSTRGAAAPPRDPPPGRRGDEDGLETPPEMASGTSEEASVEAAPRCRSRAKVKAPPPPLKTRSSFYQEIATEHRKREPLALGSTGFAAAASGSTVVITSEARSKEEDALRLHSVSLVQARDFCLL